MKNFYALLLTLFVVSLGFGQTLAAGDLAIIGLGVDDEEILVVALEDISAGESVFFTDDEWNVSSFNTGEGFYEWITPSITAGTVIVITTTGTTAGGTVTQQAGSFALGNSGDGLFLYQTSTNTYNTGTYTLLAFAGEDSGDAGTLTGSGLTLGTNAVYFAGDNGIYTGTRVGQDKSTYLSLIYDSANWTTSGTSQTFDTTAFTFNGGAPITTVEFASASASVSEGVGTTDLTFSITNADGTNATSFDVELTTGDNTDIDGYITQTVTFPAGSSTDETVTITVTDDAVFEGNETLTFTITGVTGGNNATLGTQSTFDLTIEDNESSPGFAFWHEPFNNNDFYTVTVGGEGNDGTQDYFQITDGSNIDQSYTNIDGTFHAAQDMDDGGWTNSAAPSQLTWTGIDVSEFTTLSFKGSFASNGGGIDDTDFVLVEYQIDSGGWMNLLAFENTGGFNNNFFEDTDFDGTGDGLQLTGTFQEFEKSIPVGSSLDLRVTVSVNSGGEDLAFDNFKVYGIYNGYAYSDGSWYPANPDGTTGASNAIVADGVATLSSDVSLNDVVVNPGAGLEVETGNTLTVNSLTLESSSTSYSSLILDGSISGTITYNRSVNSFTNDATNNDNDLISAPVTGQTFGSFDSANTNLLASGSTRAFAPFNNVTGAYENYDATTNAATTLDTATGYRAATTDGGTLSFTGNAESGNVSKNVTIGDDMTYGIWNLIGNPYPSYLDVETFLTHVVSTQTTGERNIDLMESASGIYGYDGDASDGWRIITLANASGELMAPGQGFFIAADGNDVLEHDIEFTPAMRTSGNADDFIQNRTNNPLTFVKLRASTASHGYNTEFYFDANATLGLDPGYDAVIWGGAAPSTFALYSHLVQDNTGMPIALQALGSSDISDVTIPLGINSNAGESLTISITEMSIPASVNVYLEDYENNTLALLNDTDFVTTPSSSLAGTGRFYLRFLNGSLSTMDNEFDRISIYPNQTNRTIVIAGQLAKDTSVSIYDLQGRLVNSKKLVSDLTFQTIDVNNLNTGIYIVKLTNGSSNRTEKIILKQ